MKREHNPNEAPSGFIAIHNPGQPAVCRECAFRRSPDCSSAPCMYDCRKDGADVYFIEKELTDAELQELAEHNPLPLRLMGPELEAYMLRNLDRVGVVCRPTSIELRCVGMLQMNEPSYVYRTKKHKPEPKEENKIVDKKPEPKSLHQVALDHLNLDPGDRVRVLFKTPDYAGGWDNEWAPSMNNTIGGTYTVRALLDDDTGVQLNTSECRLNYRYPAFCLELVERKPAGPTCPAKFREWDVILHSQQQLLSIGCKTLKLKTALDLAKRIKCTVDGAAMNKIELNTLMVLGEDIPANGALEFATTLIPVLEAAIK